MVICHGKTGIRLRIQFGGASFIDATTQKLSNTRIMGVGASQFVMLWRHDYKQFYADMGNCPPGLTIERRDNDGDYTPENCYWATRKEQQRNQRVTRKVVIEGKQYIAANLADIAGIKTDSIVERAERGLSYSEVVAKERTFNLEGFKLGAKASSIARKAITHCKNGHELTPENTAIRTVGKYSWRRCKACRRK